MTRNGRHGLAALGATIAVVALAAAGVTLVGHERESEQGAEPEFPTALGKHLEKLMEATPGNQGMAEEGPASAAEAAFLQRAYPEETISVAAGGRRAGRVRCRRRVGRSRPARAPRARGSPSDRARRSIRQDGSAQLVQLRPQPTTSQAAGRRRSRSATTASPATAASTSRRPAAASGARRTRSTGQPNWEYLGGPLGINAAGSVTIDPNDPTGNTVYVGTGEANICGSGCVAGVGLYKSTDGGDTWTGPLGGTSTRSTATASARSWSSPGSPNTIYVGDDDRAARHVVRAAAGVTRPVPGAAQVGPVQVDRRRRVPGPSSTTARPTPPTAPATLTECNNGARLLAARRPLASRSTRPNPEIVYAGSYARGVWRSPDGGATWTQIKPSLNAAVIHDAARRSPSRRSRTARPACTSTRANTGHALLRGSSAATTSRPARRSSPT